MKKKYSQNANKILFIKSGERSSGLIPAIPSNDNNKVYSASISIAVEERSTSDLCPANITLFILDREGTQCIVLSGFLELGTGIL